MNPSKELTNPLCTVALSAAIILFAAASLPAALLQTRSIDETLCPTIIDSNPDCLILQDRPAEARQGSVVTMVSVLRAVELQPHGFYYSATSFPQRRSGSRRITVGLVALLAGFVPIASFIQRKLKRNGRRKAIRIRRTANFYIPGAFYPSISGAAHAYTQY